MGNNKKQRRLSLSYQFDARPRACAWGEGYAALSKSMEDKQTIINYIINQQEHHKTVTFKDEYIAFIKEMGLDFDERDWNR
ncbi:hypothetical protein FACS189415_2950 [Bacteroidia bacterium]|nr:hypothetical protein FACS189426_16680 [Bacteroidia bacterium]GHU82466.1 hypothetical protein FACS189415_2950 [Bacteroidia bacterium]